MRTRGLVKGVVLGAAVMWGCGDGHSTDVQAPETRDGVVANEPVETIMTDLTREVALALGNDDRLRMTLYSRIKSSRVKEGKLEFAAILADEELGLLLGIARESGQSKERVRSKQQQLPPLEAYLPVPIHRSGWKGEPTLVVASALDEEGILAAFDLQGRPVSLSSSTYPEQPVLVLVPSETDFSGGSGRSAPFAVGSSQGQAMSVSGSGQLLLTRSVLSDLHEPWFRGDPEIELHVLDLTLEAWSGCVGAGQGFDQNGNVWVGSLSILSYTQLDDKNLQIWEDDGGACQAPNPDSSTELALSAAGTWAIFTGIALYNGKDAWGVQGLIAGTLSLLWGSAGFPNSDDFVGRLRLPTTSCFGTGSSAARAYLEDENGAATGDYVDLAEQGMERNTCPLVASIDGDTYACTEGDPSGQWSAGVVGGSGSTQYEWWEDGVLRGTASTYTLLDHSVGTRRIDLVVTRDAGVDGTARFVDVINDPEGENCEA